jgi:cell division transport system permease protein
MRHIKTAWQHLHRSPYQALAAIGVMTLTFFVAAIFIFIASGSQAILNWFETRPQVTGFFKDEVTMTQIEALKERLNQTNKIADIKYVSKEEALAIYREQNKDDPLLLEMVTANILPASLEVATTDLTSLGEVAKILKEAPEIDEVIFQEDVVTSLSEWTSAIRKIGLGLIIALSVFALSIILVIIGMKIALRRDEIEILRLVGASSGYVRWPFLLEGMFYGVVGAIVAWLMAVILLLYSTPFLVSFLAGIPLLPVPPLFLALVLFVLILGGLAIGTLGSLIALKRYLR